MEIEFHCDDVVFHWHSSPEIIRWLTEIATAENRLIHSLSYVYCSDQKLLEINRTHLNHDHFTDVITFDLSDSDQIEGEIYISLDRVSDHASSYNITFEEELCRVMAHGLLHLIGYNDKTDEEAETMRSKENTCLSLLPEVPRGTFEK